MKKTKSSKRGKLIALKKLAVDGGITIRRLRNALIRDEVEIVSAVVKTAGGPQTCDAAYAKEVAPALDALKLGNIGDTDVTIQEAAAELGFSVRYLETEAEHIGITMKRKLGTHDRGLFQPVRVFTAKQYKKLQVELDNTQYAEG